MMRSPLFYPLNRGQDAEAGGIADLQTDVMRFMAILALCLVAIFAIVQSIPLAPSIVEPEVEVELELEPEPTPEPAPKSEPQPEPQPVEQPQVAQVVEPVEEGFTLRFEDEQTLTRLVARDEVGLYAILPDRSFRMSINGGEISFWPASTPNQFHEMDTTTVPPAVLEAFARRDGNTTQTLRWGVTIPTATSQQLEQHLREADGGALIIDARGDLRLEQ